MQLHHFAVRSALTAVLAYASYWSIRLAYADHLFATNTDSNIRRAAELVPFSPTYQARVGNLKRALELNPYFYGAWLELAAQAEERQDFAEAERCFLNAAKVAKLFETRWSLANFYYRRANKPEFWKWIRLATERSYGDRSAIFRLCWRMTEDASEILTMLPADGPLLAEYILYLTHEQAWDAAMAAAPRALAAASTAEQTALMNLCEKLIEAGRARDAAQIWNGMIERQWLPYLPLDPVAGPWLTNATLHASPLGKGFDWRLLWRTGGQSTWTPSPPRLRVELNGKQSEQTELVAQFLPAPAGRYAFRFRYRTDRIAEGSGLRWQVGNAAAEVLAESADLSSSDWQAATFNFDLPPGAQPHRLVLVYRRRTGTVRPDGVFWLDEGMELEKVPPREARTR